MDTIKRFIKYAIWIILFWIFSDFLINVAINTTYKDIERKNQLPTGVQIVEMKATSVNGKVNLLINNSSYSGKYVKIDLYSNKDNLLGTQYLEIGNISEGQQKELNTYFKISNVKKYEISIQDEKGEETDGFMEVEISKTDMLIAVILLMLAW